MSTSADLPRALQASLSQARAKIPLAHHKALEGVVSSPDNAYIHINDWAFLNGHIYVRISGSMKEGRYRFGCIFHSRKEGQRTQNTRKLDEKDRKRANSYVRGIGCPVKITISRYVRKSYLYRQSWYQEGEKGKEISGSSPIRILAYITILLLRILSPFSLMHLVDQAWLKLLLSQKHTRECLYIRNRRIYWRG